MENEHILVIEDDVVTAQLIRKTLEKEAYQVSVADTANDALQTARSRKPQLILLDLVLPDLDGMEVFRNLRKEENTSAIPVIMLTSKNEETDIVHGLEAGAEDYITKPFSPGVLVARIKKALRTQKTPGANDALDIHNISIHPGRHEVSVNGELVHLTLSEFKILHLLARKPGWVFSRYQIVESIRNESTSVTERSVDVLIVGLRRKLGDSGTLIETVRGIGYRFKEAGDEDS